MTREKLTIAIIELRKVHQGIMPSEEGKKLIGQINKIKCKLSAKENSRPSYRLLRARQNRTW
jgi:hypothetical protein